ncbi:MAG: hypothetical protein LBB10_00585 [Bifidobacteriaceae bacterium]|jgi:hypothetical protein|nr:hypothetical protein [Bifidobacteriaceae bacterium]
MKADIFKKSFFSLSLFAIVLSIAGCSGSPVNSKLTNDITFDQGSGAVVWNPPGQKFEFTIDKSFKFDSNKSDNDTNDVHGEFNTRIIYADAKDSKSTATFRADYQDDDNRSGTRVAELKKQTDMHKVFGLGSSQKIVDQGTFTSNNVLYAAWAKTYPVPNDEKIVAVNFYVLTIKGHVSFIFETTNGFNFSEEFIQSFIKSVKVEV